MYQIQLKLTILIFLPNLPKKGISSQKIALVRAAMVVTYYIKLFKTGANRDNGFLMFLILLVAETIILLRERHSKMLRHNLNSMKP